MISINNSFCYVQSFSGLIHKGKNKNKRPPGLSKEAWNDKQSRFVSPEMQQARTMTQFAIKDIRAPKKESFDKATPEDLKRLTSDSVEDSYSRVKWENPKNGKTYYLLKEKDSDDKNVHDRILKENGEFIKEANLKPQNVLIIDVLAKVVTSL